VHAQLTAPLAVRLQGRDDVRIDLDDVQRAGQRQHGCGDGAPARADFDETIARARIDGADDTVDRAGVVQEVLPVTLLGVAVLHQ